MLNKVLNKYNHLKIKNKILILYGVSAIIYFIIFLVTLQIGFKIYRDQLYNSSLFELDFIIQDIDNELSNIETVSESIALDSTVQRQLMLINTINKDDASYAYEQSLFFNMLVDIVMKYDFVNNVTFTNKKDIKFDIGSANNVVDNETLEILLQKFHELKGGYYMLEPTTESPILYSGRDILYKIDGSLDYIGSIVLSTDIYKILDEKVSKLRANTPAFWLITNNNIVYRSKYTNNLVLPALEGNNGYKIINQNGEKYFLCYIYDSNRNIKYVNMFPYTEIYGLTSMSILLMFISFAIIFTILALIIIRFSGLITKPLIQLSTSMRTVETGDFTLAKSKLAHIHGNDEVGILVEEFQIMLDKIDTLISEDYKNKFLLMDTKYKMLQAQMNPHFLYNTLGTINWMVRYDQKNEASSMILELSELLRASISKSQFVTIERDLNLTKNYINIQEVRYKDRVKFKINIKGNYKNYYIPHMTIQPLVENVIQHVVDNSLVPCLVEIEITEKQNHIEIKIIDDGPGLSPSEINDILNFKNNPNGNGIGIKNIKERIMMINKDSKFHIESEVGVGTTVCMNIPKLKEGEINVHHVNS